MSRVAEAVAALEERAEARIRDGLARYGIATSDRVIGVPMAGIQKVARLLGRDHGLAGQLWTAGVYEARMLAAYVEEPERVTPEQMDLWARDFDNWATCDTLCFALFDRTAHAYHMVDRWADDPAEFVRRAAFALLASLALHDKKREDEAFLARLPLIEAASSDDRNFVKKGVSWRCAGSGNGAAPPCGRRPASWPCASRLRRRRARDGSAGMP